MSEDRLYAIVFSAVAGALIGCGWMLWAGYRPPDPPLYRRPPELLARVLIPQSHPARRSRAPLAAVLVGVAILIGIAYSQL